jgi:hypothetical protein
MTKMKYIIATMALIISSAAYSHEMVPTYPKLEPAYVDGLYRTTMTMFNKRPEVEYYEIGVFTQDWEPIKFVSNYKVYKVPYLSTVSFDIYVRSEDRYDVTYICSVSKLRQSSRTRTAVSSKICSRVKRLGE